MLPLGTAVNSTSCGVVWLLVAARWAYEVMDSP